MAAGPGLRKVTLPTLFRERWVRLVSVTDGRLRDLVDRADVVSEGGVRDEAGVPTYYGTTNILIERDAVRGLSPEVVLFALRADPHTRLRIVRIAHREASSRVTAGAAAFQVEIAIDETPSRITISVDVVAKLVGATSAIGG